MNLRRYQVLTQWDGPVPAPSTQMYLCQAEGLEHAIEQAFDAYPQDRVVAAAPLSTKLSDILWMGANLYLSEYADDGDNQLKYSCDAVNDACFCGDDIEGWYTRWKEVEQFLYELGCPVRSFDAFSEFEEGFERQAARYTWLMFASMIAKEEGR